ncbi:MAG: CRTAC1 family protein [Holophagales bacterium]|nr:CRTAC1 family protein [Holophagales bacterium]MYG30238.1 CRTAC1 family protein [Holophagales bacterium]
MPVSGNAQVPALALALAATAITGTLAAEEGTPVFVDRAQELGLRFVHDNGMTGELYFAENMGGGAALFDADGDGDLDLYLGQGHRLAPAGDASPPGAPEPGDRLYRNDLEAGELRFTDITEASGLDARGYGMGVTVGDIDNDGDPDLYILNLGPNELWRNDSEPGAIRFTNITAGSNTADPRWSAAASFFDLDGDGLLDLFVGNYVEFRVAIHKTCSSPQGLLDYCGPKAYRDEPNRVLRNRGGGVFEDWTFRLGVGDLRRPTLGTVATDLNGDGTTDVYVANDQSQNTLLLNQGGTALVDEAVLAGAAVDAEGQPEASMGVLAEDFNGDGLVDLFMTHLQHQTNTLYVNEGGGFWEDRTRRSGLGQPSFVYTGFGAAAMDYDLDGELDIYVANGAVKRIEEQVRTDDPHPLREPNQLFRGLGGGRFEEVPDFERPAAAEVSRGVARGDLDNDGDPDLVVVNNGGPVRVLINERAPGDRDWLGVDLRLAPAGEALLGRRALGAWLGTVEADEARSWRRFHTDGSYASANDPRVIVVSPTGTPTTLVARWPDGATETFRVEVSGGYVTLVRGEGSTETRKGTP